MSELRALAGVFYREWALFRAGQSDYWMSLITPIIYLLFFVPGVGNMLTDSGHPYALFAFPGVVVIMALNVAQSVGAPVFFDRYTGEVETLFTLPVPRSALLLGRLVTTVLRTWVQTSITMLLAAVLYPPVRSLSPLSLLAVVIGSGGLALMLGALFIWLATVVRNQSQFNTVMNVTVVPLLLTSSAFYPVDRLPIWLGILAKANPLTYSLACMRAFFGLQPLKLVDLLFPITFLLVITTCAAYRYQRLSR